MKSIRFLRKSKVGVVLTGVVLAVAVGTAYANDVCRQCLINYYECVDNGGSGCSLRLSQCLRAAGCSQI